jgi:hypothetical protein
MLDFLCDLRHLFAAYVQRVLCCANAVAPWLGLEQDAVIGSRPRPLGG